MTGLEVFTRAMTIMDNLSEGSGNSDTDDNRPYKLRTVEIINLLAPELYPYSATYRAGKGRAFPDPISDIGDEIDLDDYICAAVLPYGLAAHLSLGEDDSMANFFQQRYEELSARLSRGVPAESEAVKDVYAGLFDRNFARW